MGYWDICGVCGDNAKNGKICYDCEMSGWRCVEMLCVGDKIYKDMYSFYYCNVDSIRNKIAELALVNPEVWSGVLVNEEHHNIKKGGHIIGFI